MRTSHCRAPRNMPAVDPLAESGRLPTDHCPNWPVLFSHQIHHSSLWRAWCTKCGSGVAAPTEAILAIAVARWHAQTKRTRQPLSVALRRKMLRMRRRHDQ